MSQIEHPLDRLFAEAIRDALRIQLGMRGTEEVERYLATLLARFVSTDGVYAIRDAEGHPLTAVADMVEEGDVRLKANSFAREREVHKHIGDYLLFWTGLFPEYLNRLRSPAGKDALLDPINQARTSYFIAGSFTHAPFTEEAAVLQRLSEEFDAYRYGLGFVRRRVFDA